MLYIKCLEYITTNTNYYTENWKTTDEYTYKVCTWRQEFEGKHSPTSFQMQLPNCYLRNDNACDVSEVVPRIMQKFNYTIANGNEVVIVNVDFLPDYELITQFVNFFGFERFF